MPWLDPEMSGRSLNCDMAKALVQGWMRTGALMDPVYYRWMTEWMEG